MPKKTPASETRQAFAGREKSRPLTALIIFGLAVLFMAALLHFEPVQVPENVAGAEPSQNIAGKLGAYMSYYTLFVFGGVAYIIPILLFLGAYLLLFKQAHRVNIQFVLAAIVLVLSLCGLSTMLQDYAAENFGSLTVSPFPDGETATPTTRQGELPPMEGSSLVHGWGGFAGKLAYSQKLVETIGAFGSAFVLVLLAAIAIPLLLTENIATWFENREARRKRREAARQEREQKRAAAEAKRAEKAEKERAAKTVPVPEPKDEKAEPLPVVPAPRPPTTRRPILGDDAPEVPPKKLAPGQAMLDPEPVIDTYIPEAERVDLDKEPAAATKRKETRFSLNKRSREAEAESAKKHAKNGLTIISEEKVEKAPQKLPERKGDYIFPQLSMLQDPPDMADGEGEDHEKTAEQLVQTLNEFNVKVHPSEVQTGPVITRYEVTPAAGVRVEKIVNLDKNIALGLKALSVRILAPVPGKGTVGIEVPNRKPKPVCMKEIIETRAWVDSKAEIPIVLGKDVTGRPIVEDLTKMPHMLIAGSTGSGKTVCINSVIASLLYHAGPEDLRFIMVDPKVVEMQVYNSLPHMLIPVVTDPKMVPSALKYLIREMERRYQIFAKVGVRNIAGFNSMVTRDKEEKARAQEYDQEISSSMSPEERAAANSLEVPRDDGVLEVPKKRLPYIVCVIDELADLMMVAPQDIETCVARLAQLARAAGIHLILATQRPSVNVITGVIKANLPTRISFKVASKVDSRTILDQQGAEALIGKGDMLFIPPGTSHLTRAQGAFVSDDEINAIVEFLKENNGPPQFDEEIQRAIEAGDEGDDGGPTTAGEYEDELVPQAIEIVRSSQRASVSYLQRRLKVGYNRAARIMEILEDEGIVGPENGSSPREILVE